MVSIFDLMYIRKDGFYVFEVSVYCMFEFGGWGRDAYVHFNEQVIKDVEVVA